MSTPAAVKVSRQVRLGLVLLVVLPCLPGVTFLLTGFSTDPHRYPRDESPAAQAEYARTWARTRSLYLAGGVTLIVGTLGMGAVLWKIAHPGPSYEEEERLERERERESR